MSDEKPQILDHLRIAEFIPDGDEDPYDVVRAMKSVEAYPRRAAWPESQDVRQWEERLWVYVDGARVAPWCPTPGDLVACDWEWREAPF